jgi:hypothetical protein
MMRMKKIEPFYWQCSKCGAQHDERIIETNSPPSEGADSRTGVSDGCASTASLPDAGVTQEGTTCGKEVGAAAGMTAHPGETLRRELRAQPDAHAGVL